MPAKRPEKALTGACDCHVHVVGSLEKYPQSGTRSYTAQPAPLDSLRALAAPEGVSRFVIVQASFHGNDNSCLLVALGKLEKLGRGVAAVDLNYTTSSLLQGYHRFGVRGLRVNLYSKSLAFAPERIGDRLQAAIERLPSKKWHVEVIAPVALLVKAATVIAKSPVPIVLDHYGLPGEASPEKGEGRQLLKLASLPHVWVKLTAPYRVVADPLATTPPADWLAAFLRVAPQRCVWGSDWPHTPLERDQKGVDQPAPYRKISYARLLQDFVAALPDSATARRILIENPQRLYGFAKR
jgi:predicted TIM-barrel fold metal-dependent hydrolase